MKNFIQPNRGPSLDLLLLLVLFAFVVSGVPASTAAATLTATYNDLESVKALFEANKGECEGGCVALGV